MSSDLDHRRAAQRLRYQVFASEPGFDIPASAEGLDADPFDLTGYDWVMGCVSVPMRDTPADPPGVNVAGVRNLLLSKHAGDPEHRVRPYRPVLVDGRGLDEVDAPARPKLPPLLRGYLRLGAEICGEPAHDPDFGVVDFVALLGLETINTRYLERLQGAAEAMDAHAAPAAGGGGA